MNKRLFVGLLVFCLMFVTSGALNYGFSRFYPSIPFMSLSIWISLKRLRSLSFSLFIIGYSVVSIFLNFQLEKSSLFFPILNQGTVTINRPGFLLTFRDGSSGFFEEESVNAVSSMPLKPGNVFDVTGVKMVYPDFGTEVQVQTSIGLFTVVPSYLNGAISTNKDIERPFFKHIGSLMYYPILPLLLKNAF